MPQPVRRDAFGETGALRGLRHDRLRHLDAHPVRARFFLPPRDEERRVFVLAGPQVALEPLPRAHTEEDAPVAAAFPEHGDLVRDAHAVLRIDRMGIELELVAIQRNELRLPTAGGGQELEERAIAETVVGRGVKALEEPFELLLVEVPGVGTWIGRLGELDLLRSRDRQVQQDPELEKAAQRDQVQVLRGGRNWFLTRVAAREEPTAREVAREGLQDAEIDVLHPRVSAVPPDELDELQKEPLVPRQRRFAPSFVAQLLQICPCEVL